MCQLLGSLKEVVVSTTSSRIANELRDVNPICWCCWNVATKKSLISTHLIKSSHGVDPIANMHYHTISKQVTMDAQWPLISHIRGTIYIKILVFSDSIYVGFLGFFCFLFFVFFTFETMCADNFFFFKLYLIHVCCRYILHL